MRPLRVVDVAPAVEGALGSGEIGKGWAGQHLGLEAAVEAFVLAHGLRMIGPRMADPDAVLDQPDPERSERATRSVAPGRAVVGDQPLRQAVAAEGDDELLPDRLGPLVGTGRKHHGEARVIVEHGQRMQPAVCKATWPLKSICHNSLGRARSKRVKADWPPPCAPTRSRAAARSPSPSRAPERFLPQILQPPGDLAATPGRMLRTHRKHCLLRNRSALRWRIPRTTRQLLKPRLPFEPPTLQPLVAGRRADAEATAQLPNIRPFHRRQHHKFQSRVHPATSWNGIRQPPYSLPKVSTMSPNTCPPCPRSEQWRGCGACGANPR